jgi:hypothetical protein
MMFVQRMQEVRVHFDDLRDGTRYVILGFLLNANSHRGLWTYLHGESMGAVELDHLTGDESAVFALDDPPRSFVTYVRDKRKDHTWLRIFRPDLVAPTPPRRSPPHPKHKWLAWLFGRGDKNGGDITGSGVTGVVNSGNQLSQIGPGSPVAIGSHININFVPAGSLFEGAVIDPIELQTVLNNFNLSYGDMPCLIWFEDLDASATSEPIRVPRTSNASIVSRFFVDYFAGPRFRELLEDARADYARV